METSESECIDALERAAAALGESPTKKQYEELGLQPASGTIMRVFGGWNAAKEAAGLETYDPGEAGGREVEPKPEWVDLPDDREWTDLNSQQRWYYKNREERIERKDRRRAELREWLYQYKRENCQCKRCDEARPACLDFHHPGEKERGIARMIARGYSKSNIEAEIERCIVLCANCHRVEHYTPPQSHSGERKPDSNK